MFLFGLRGGKITFNQAYFYLILMKTKKTAALRLPLADLKFLYRTNRGDKLVLEVDIDALKQVNEPNTVDEMVAEARFEYFVGKTQGFRDIKKLMAYLEA